MPLNRRHRFQRMVRGAQVLLPDFVTEVEYFGFAEIL